MVTPITPAPLEGVANGEPRCMRHGTGYAYHGFSTGAPPAHTWDVGPLPSYAPPGCLRCGGQFQVGDRYLCDEGGIVHVACPYAGHTLSEEDASAPLTGAEQEAIARAIYPPEDAVSIDPEEYADVTADVYAVVERIVTARVADAAAKARADERERIAQAVEALPGPNLAGVALWLSTDAREGYLLAIEEAATAARIARRDA